MANTVSAKLTSFLEQINLAKKQALVAGIKPSPELARTNMQNLSALSGHGPEIQYVSDGCLVINTATGNTIAYRIYSPAPAKPLPVVIHLHGGGHMCGGIDTYDAISRRIARFTNSIVITPDYRLAPEHPYPQAILDCKFLLSHYPSLLNDIAFKEELIVAGDSAGGALAATLSASGGIGDAKINKQILIYPSLDYTMKQPSIDTYQTGFLLEKAGIEWYFDNYLQHGEDRKQVSPLYMPAGADSPETLMIIARCDPLQDEAYAYNEKLKQAGVAVSTHTLEGMVHGFMQLHSLVEAECTQVYKLMNEFITPLEST